MNKIEGILFLKQLFPEITLNSFFVKDTSELTYEILKAKSQMKGNFWRVRGACFNNSELKLPMGTFYNEEDVLKFISKCKEENKDLFFILHSINNEYYYPEYSGSLVVYNDSKNSDIVIELQRVTKELVNSMDGGERPRDWEVCIGFHYRYLLEEPQIINYKNVNVNQIINSVQQIFHVGCKIFDEYEKKKWITASYTRFNLYDNGIIILNDHRSTESFV